MKPELNLWKRLAKAPILACLFASMLSPASADSIRQPTIAIIIDDMGNHYYKGLELIRMPYPLTLSFLPDRRYTKSLSELAYRYDKEIMLHAPMENILGLNLGSGALTSQMNEQQIRASLIKSLRAIPNVVGVNNHMGSKLTSNPQIMTWLMDQLRHYPYYFIDSRTTPDTVAAHIAHNHQVPSMSRDVFLDHRQTREFVQQQFLRLLDIAKEKGSAIAIAHPHRVTIDYLSYALEKLDRKGIRIATVSSLWQVRHPGKTMYADRQKPHSLALAKKKSITTHSDSQEPQLH